MSSPSRDGLRPAGRLLLLASVMLAAASCRCPWTPGTDPVPGPQGPPRARVLRVCADPNNLPFSNERQEGFENRIAEIVARDMDATLEYTWWAQRRGFVRNTLRAESCDVVMGVPAGYDPVLSTQPYYRSTYVFATREDSALHLGSLDDSVLRRVRIGVHVIGEDYANPPPAHALAARGVIANVVGYSIYGDYAEPDPPARLLDALAHREIDVAIVWGPFAGAYARRTGVALRVVPVPAPADLPFLPFAFDIAMGVRRGDTSLRAELDGILVRRRDEIARVLDDFGIPRVDAADSVEAS
jgi:mxaJ protein